MVDKECYAPCMLKIPYVNLEKKGKCIVVVTNGYRGRRGRDRTTVRIATNVGFESRSGEVYSMASHIELPRASLDGG